MGPKRILKSGKRKSLNFTMKELRASKLSKQVLDTLEELDGSSAADENKISDDKKSVSNEPKCDKCEESFVSARELEKHAGSCMGKPVDLETTNSNMTPIVNLNCYEDEDQNVDEPELNESCFCCRDLLETAHKSGSKVCFLCPKKFSSKVSLERHISNLHAITSTFGCPDCDCTCQDQSTLNRHRAMDHGYSDKLFICPQCDKTFTRKYHMDRHLQQTRCGGMIKLSFPCEFCDKEFSRKDNLCEHVRVHKGNPTRKKSYECEMCKRSFSGITLYNVHMRTHTGEKPFACKAENCTKRFTSSFALKKHTRTHTGEKPYECNVCQNKFAAKESLNRHMKIHTSDKPFKCELCGKSFIQNTQLRAHMFHHTGENGFVCSICGEAFDRNTRLRLHERFVHEGEKRLECDECNKTFMRKEDLAKHKVKHTVA